jgi:hypothetical protein
VYRLGNQFPMSSAVASQLIRYDLTWLIAVTFEQSCEEDAWRPCHLCVPARIHQRLRHPDRPRATDTAAYLGSSRTPRRGKTVRRSLVGRAVLVIAPQPDRLTTDFNPPLCQQLFNITMAEIESEIEPHRVRDDIGRESMAFIYVGGGTSIYSRILAQRQLIWQYLSSVCLDDR